MYDPCTNSVVLGVSSGETLAHYPDQYLACDNTRINQTNKKDRAILEGCT